MKDDNEFVDWLIDKVSFCVEEV